MKNQYKPLQTTKQKQTKNPQCSAPEANQMTEPNPTQETTPLLSFPRVESTYYAVLWSNQDCHQPQAARQILPTYMKQKT